MLSSLDKPKLDGAPASAAAGPGETRDTDSAEIKTPAAGEVGASANNDLHKEQPVYKGDPENQVIVIDMDETVIAGDKETWTKDFEAKVNAMGDRKVETISKKDPINKLGSDIKYVARPGLEDLLEHLHFKGYKIIFSTRNFKTYADAIINHNPILAKYASGSLSREDLLGDINKDFKKYPNHPDNLGFFTKLKLCSYKYFIYAPKYCWLKFKSLFTGKTVRWNPGRGTQGKYPPNMIELLKAKGNNKLSGLQPPRFIIDNKFERTLLDSKNSKDFAVVNPDVDHNGDGQVTDFKADSKAIKVKLQYPDSKQEAEGYLWVKNVIDAIELGWRAQFEKTTGSKPIKKQ